MVTRAHFLSQDGDGGFEGTFAEFFEGWLGGGLPYGRWADHVRSWLLRGGVAEASVLVVTYENLKERLPEELARINAFLGLPPLGPEEEARLLEVRGVPA